MHTHTYTHRMHSHAPTPTHTCVRTQSTQIQGHNHTHRHTQASFSGKHQPVVGEAGCHGDGSPPHHHQGRQRCPRVRAPPAVRRWPVPQPVPHCLEQQSPDQHAEAQDTSETGRRGGEDLSRCRAAPPWVRTPPIPTRARPPVSTALRPPGSGQGRAVHVTRGYARGAHAPCCGSSRAGTGARGTASAG